MSGGARSSTLEILHFNDVYNVDSRAKEPVGGAARFVTKVKALQKRSTDAGKPRPLVIFSGDAFNPSIMSTITKGKQMVPVLNNAGVDIALYGNHDFDFGLDNLIRLAERCNFVWLLSNVVYKPTGRQLADGAVMHIVDDAGGSGQRVGFIGLVESEWMATLATLDEADIEYEDFCACARRLGTQLRVEKKCDLVVALTHMRLPNDERLARECGDVIDLVLGGHDHDYHVSPVGEHGIYVCKSGTDFRQMTHLGVRFDSGDPSKGQKRPVVEFTEQISVTAEVTPDPATVADLETFTALVGKKMETMIGETCVPLEARFSYIRTQETNLSNFVADILRRGTGADIALLNSGTLRADSVFEAGPLLTKDLMALLPMIDMTCVVRVNGEQLLRVLENGVSQYPRLEGRFPCVSGVKFSFDAQRMPGDRVLRESVFVDGQPLKHDQHYTVATKAYLASGKDGYDAFQEGTVVMEPEVGPILPTLVRNTFTELHVLNGFRSHSHNVLRSAKQWKEAANIRQKSSSTAPDGPGSPVKIFGICPEVEGRIVCINPIVVHTA